MNIGMRLLIMFASLLSLGPHTGMESWSDCADEDRNGPDDVYLSNIQFKARTVSDVNVSSTIYLFIRPFISP